jgi:hypothetical protein
MGDKPRRDRKWGANQKLKKLPKSDQIHDQAGNVRKEDFEEVLKWLYQYARDMHAWGRDVRDDIVRLEEKAGLAPGDPGDPPDGPPNGDGEE